MNKQTEARWMAERLAVLEPEWTADTEAAAMRLDEKAASRGRSESAWVPVAAAAALALAAIVVPQGRALAQELWFRLIATRVDVVRLDLSNVPLDTQVISNGMEQRVATVDEAEQKAGYRPYLPTEGLLGLSVTGRISVTQTVRVSKLNIALEKAGASDARVPPEWDGVTVRAEIGPMVVASYGANVQVGQSKPVEIFAPAGFPLDRLAEAALRSVGLPWWEARLIGRRFAAQPALLLGIPPDEAAAVREVTVRGRTGMLVEDFDEHGAPQRASVMFSGPDRMYAVSSPTAELSLRIANTLP
jgi:hypothetical protein